MAGLLGQKLGMTQIYTEDGVQVPVTVIKAGPCCVVSTKTPAKEGYSAIQVGFGEAREKKLNQARRGHFKRYGVGHYRYLKEFRTDRAADYASGDRVTVEGFAAGDRVDISGVSKGKGFQGVIKRHHFAGMPSSHGCSVSHRVPGSIGQRTYPGKVIKGKKLPGQMGFHKVTIRGLEVVGIEPEQNILLIKGGIPGHNDCIVMIRPRGSDFEKRILALKTKATSGTEAAVQPQQSTQEGA